MIIVSGCPRSGTSLMMDCMRVALGEDKIIGDKFPQERILQKREYETDDEHDMRMYAIKRYNPQLEKNMVDSQDMNPNGFWECEYTVRGVTYSGRVANKLARLENNGRDYACKIVSQGIVRSDPQYIDKIVFMLRDPHSVAKSQERINIDFFFKNDIGEDVNLFADKKLHSPQMFINATASVANWLIANPDIPIIYIDYEDILTKPDDILCQLKEFIGFGKFEKAVSLIDKSLYRSYPEDVKNSLWEDADFIYMKFKEKKFEEIVEYMKDLRRESNRQQRSWKCFRSGSTTVEKFCKSCKSKKSFRESLKERAVGLNVDWKNEPCVFECFKDIDSEHITVEESIENNFWI